MFAQCRSALSQVFVRRRFERHRMYRTSLFRLLGAPTVPKSITAATDVRSIHKSRRAPHIASIYLRPSNSRESVYSAELIATVCGGIPYGDKCAVYWYSRTVYAPAHTYGIPFEKVTRGGRRARFQETVIRHPGPRRPTFPGEGG